MNGLSLVLFVIFLPPRGVASGFAVPKRHSSVKQAAKAVVRFYNRRGPAEPRIRGGKATVTFGDGRAQLTGYKQALDTDSVVAAF